MQELRDIREDADVRNYFFKHYNEDERRRILNSSQAGDSPAKLMRDELRERMLTLTFGLQTLGDDHSRLDNLYKRTAEFFNDYDTNKKWVVIEDKFNGDPSKPIMKITFQPLFVYQYTNKYFFNLGDIIIIMSATILNPEKLAHDLGIGPRDYKYIAIEPQFGKDSNKIYNLAIANFETNMEESKKEVDIFWKHVIKKIDLILQNHKNEKGIIHGNTHEICKKIKQYSKYPNRIIIHSDNENPDNLDYRQQKVDEHCKSKEPTVLCSPSMAEGVDLKDDFSRFQILVKMPYPDIGNEWISARMEADRRYFKTKTAITICQAIGRSVRNKNDWCITYTLDSRFKDYMKWDSRLTELFKRHESPLTDLTRLWKNNQTQLRELLKEIPRREKNLELINNIGVNNIK